MLLTPLGTTPTWRARAGRWLLGQLPVLAVAALVLGGLAHLVRSEREAAQQAEVERQAAEAAQRAAWDAVAGRGDMGGALARCRTAWSDVLGLHHEPLALAFSRDELDAYFLEGSDRASLRQVRCRPLGVSRGVRVAHPLRSQLPAEAAPAPATGDDESWAPELLRQASRTLAADEQAVEIAVHPGTHAVLVRIWRSGPGGARPEPVPAGAPSFPLLIAGSAFQPALDALPPSLETLQRSDWLEQPGAAFSLLGRELPAGARVSELTLEADRIQIQIASPTPSFDGKPPAPFGDKSFDEYGVADADWWYPRSEPGFGCRSGQDLAAVQADFAAAQAGLGGRPLSSAWYSCSPAYSNGQRGAWHLVPK